LWVFTPALGGRDPETIKEVEAVRMFEQDRGEIRCAEIAEDFDEPIEDEDDDLSFLDPDPPTIN
jgi:hypothetical protein